jgi:Rad3-related DNA helicase
MRYNCKGAVDVGCCLANARERFAHNEPTLLNTMSAFVNRARMKVSPGINYLDEAHGLCSTVRNLASTTIKFGPTERAILKKLKYEKHELVSEIKMCNFLSAKIDRFQMMMAKSKDDDDIQKYYEIIENTKFVYDAISLNPEVYIIEFDEGSLRVLPVFAPRAVLDRVLGKTGIVASGTLLPENLKELLGDAPYEEYECRSPIPADRRQVVYDPVACKFDYQSIRPDLIAKKIWDIYLEKKRAPLFVHSTYGLAQKMMPFLVGPEVMYHTKETKIEAVEAFKERGGILIGSGMSQGLDLAGPKFQAQIITQLTFPNLGDLYVKKRKALLTGDAWYNEETATHFLQAIGRTTRGPTDYSETFVLDSRFPWVYDKWKKAGLINQDVADSIMRKC